jgi:hypothetical protein
MAAPIAAIWRRSGALGRKAASSASPVAAPFTTFCSHPSDSTCPQMLNGDGRLAW